VRSTEMLSVLISNMTSSANNNLMHSWKFWDRRWDATYEPASIW